MSLTTELEVSTVATDRVLALRSRLNAMRPRKKELAGWSAWVRNVAWTNRSPLFLRRKCQAETGDAFMYRRGRRSEMQSRGPHVGVETAIRKPHAVRPNDLAPNLAAAFALDAPHLEDIGEIIAESQRQREVDSIRAMVHQRNSLMQGAVAQVNAARDVDEIFEKIEVSVGVDVWISQVYVIADICVVDGRMQQQRPRTFEQQLKVRKVTCIAIEQTILAARASADIAVAVEHGEGVVVLQIAPRPCRRIDRRNVEGCLAGGDVSRHCFDVRSLASWHGRSIALMGSSVQAGALERRSR